MRRGAPLLCAATLFAASVPSLALIGCRSSGNLASRNLDDPAGALTEARCGGTGQIVRPLIVEWPATDRASLETRLRRGVVVVRYSGCSVEVLRECHVPEDHPYHYMGITRKFDNLAIRTADELRVNMPLTAIELEAELEKAGQLNVSMALVGNYEATQSRFDIEDLIGRCDGATHVIAVAQVGAFEFYTGASAEIAGGLQRAGAEAGEAGIGGRSAASREILNRDGEATACESSSPSDATPPDHCGALLRLELSALDGIVPTCQSGLVWNGQACMEPERAATTTEDYEIAWNMCWVQIDCNALAMGVLPPEGQALTRQLQRCSKFGQAFVNDYTRPQLRQCVADYQATGRSEASCKTFEACAGGPQLDDPVDDPVDGPFDDPVDDPVDDPEDTFDMTESPALDDPSFDEFDAGDDFDDFDID